MAQKKRKPGRPPKRPSERRIVTTVRLPGALLRSFRAACRRDKVSMGSVVERLVADYLEARNRGNK